MGIRTTAPLLKGKSETSEKAKLQEKNELKAFKK
jgi:hypothetical protein